MSQIKATVIADSITPDGERLTSFELVYPRWILAELNTHRAFSRSSASSRAIPVRKLISQVWNDPAQPVHWGRNQAGMQAKEELTGWKLLLGKASWWAEGKIACGFAWFNSVVVGMHKQLANRGLEKRQLVRTIVTATDFGNFFILRDHLDAQPEILELAAKMKMAMATSRPQLLQPGEYHAPYVTGDEIATHFGTDTDFMIPVLSTARCARVSYLLHNGTKPDAAKDLDLFEKLVISRPAHASPAEHCAIVDPSVYRSRNFQGGWKQFREVLELDGWGPWEATGSSEERGA